MVSHREINSQTNKPLAVNIVADYRQRRVQLRDRTVILSLLLTIIMLTIIQPPWQWSFLAWFALVPWVIAVSGAANSKRLFLYNYLAGVVYFLVNVYWLVGVTAAGYVALSLYLGIYFVLSGYIIRRIYINRRWPFTFVLPVIWVGQEYLRAIMLTGFPWFFLGHSQHNHLMLIQISDIVGAYGVTFIIAMVNGLMCDLLLRPIVTTHKHEHAKTTTNTLILITAACLFGTIVYGWMRLKQLEQTIQPGPLISVIQDSIPQFTKDSGQSDRDIFDSHMKLSQQAIIPLHTQPYTGPLKTPRTSQPQPTQAETTTNTAKPLVKPDLIVWPETMVPGYINDEFTNLPDNELSKTGIEVRNESRQYKQKLSQLTSQGVALLVGGSTLLANTQGKWDSYNSAFFFPANSTDYTNRYDKMHLVPFGEVVPFKQSWPWLHKLLNKLTPYDYDYTLNSGNTPTVFTLQSHGKQYNFAVAICYEDVMPNVLRKLVANQGYKKVSFVVNISNDGWFVLGGQNGKKLRGTSEQIQHMVMSQFRAIENRVGIARAVNTGISGFIRPDGSVQTKPIAGSLANKPAQRLLQIGYLTDRVYINANHSATIYELTGDSFAIACTIIMAIFILLNLRSFQHT